MIHNDLSKTSIISIGQEIKIPLEVSAFEYSTTQSTVSIPVVYRVKSKETLFRISKVYFPQTIEAMVERNRLAQLSLSLDQQMIVAYFSLDRSKIQNYSDPEILTTVMDTVSQIVEADDEAITIGSQRLFQKRGIAIWNKSGSDKTNAFVLHREAKVNSIIEIYNPCLLYTSPSPRDS